MEKQLTRTEITNIADKVYDLIKSELGDSCNEAFIETVLYTCNRRIDLQRRIRVAHDPLAA